MKRFALLGAAGLLLAGPVSAQDSVPTIDTGDTAFVLVSAALVLLMTPGLAFFYGGMVRGKNVLGTMMQSFVAIAIISVQWVLFGYALSFGADQGGFIGGLDWLGLQRRRRRAQRRLRRDHPAPGLHDLPVHVRGHHAGAHHRRVRRADALQGLRRVPAPVGDARLRPDRALGLGRWAAACASMGALDFAGGTVVHISSGVSALVARAGARQAARLPATTPMPPHNLPFTVLGAGLLWFGWFGFNAGSALGGERPGRQRLRRHQHGGRGGDPRLDRAWTGSPRASRPRSAPPPARWPAWSRSRPRRRLRQPAGGDRRSAALGGHGLLRRRQPAREDRRRRLARRLRRARRRRHARRAAHRRVRVEGDQPGRRRRAALRQPEAARHPGARGRWSPGSTRRWSPSCCSR